MPEREVYDYFDSDAITPNTGKGKILKRRLVDFTPSKDYANVYREYKYESGDSENLYITTSDRSLIVGTLTGNYRRSKYFDWHIRLYEVKLFNHIWNSRGQAIFYVELEIRTGEHWGGHWGDVELENPFIKNGSI